MKHSMLIFPGVKFPFSTISAVRLLGYILDSIGTDRRKSRANAYISTNCRFTRIRCTRLTAIPIVTSHEVPNYACVRLFAAGLNQ